MNTTVATVASDTRNLSGRLDAVGKQPMLQVTRQLDCMGIDVGVFDPWANRPAKGDFFSVMQHNIANLRQAYANQERPCNQT